MKGQTNTTIFSWQAYEFKETERKPDWFWALGIIAVAGSVASFIYGNILFGIFIIIAAASVMYVSMSKPRLITYSLTDSGVIYEGVFYPYETLHAFWLEETDQQDKKLLIKSERFLVPILALPYDTEDTGDKAREVLLEFVPEEPLQEPWGHLIMERLGF